MQTRSFGAFAAFTAMFAVGTGVTVSAQLVDYPVFAAQAVRYFVAAAILIGAVVVLRRPFPRPRGTDWLWLIGVATTGLVIFNVAVIRSVEHAEPAVVAVFIGAVPLVLLLAEAVRLRQRPSPLLLVGAVLVVIGAALVQGGGRATVEGLAWAVVALACEAAFTLLAVPVLGRLGAVGVSIHTCWIAALMLGALALGIDGAGALPPMHSGAILALAYLAVIQTALAFSLWYSSVGILGAAVAGLFAGVMPIAAALTGVIPGLTTVTPMVIGGSVLVGVGIALGLSARLARTEKDETTPAAGPEPVSRERQASPLEG
jgi:drug/metabolite transporter (DMT)-like permease